MTRIQLKRLGIYSAIAVAASAGTLLAVRARAAGIPAAAALTYTGYLENPDGTPVTGKKSIGLSFYDAATDGSEVCVQKPADIEPVSGRFQIALPDKCAAAVQANPDLWVEVAVEGALLGRTKLGAVPYALEAAHADTATDAVKAGALDKRLLAVETLGVALENGLPSKSAMLVHLNQGQVYASGTGGTVLFEQKDFDAGSEYSAATGKFTSKSGGFYSVSCSLQWKVTTAGTNAYFQTTVFLNQNTATGIQQETTNDGLYPTVEAHGVIKLNANDALLCQAYQSSGVSLPLNNDAVSVNRFSVVRVSPL